MDCPGQVELFTLHESLVNIVQTMTDKWHIRWALSGTILLPKTMSTILFPASLNPGSLHGRDHDGAVPGTSIDSSSGWLWIQHCHLHDL